MGVLTTGNWSVAGRGATGTTGKIHEHSYIIGKQRLVNLKLTLASGTLPAGSVISLPGAGSVGFARNLDRYILDNMFFASGTVGAAASGTVKVSYNATGNKIKFFRAPKGILASGTGTAGGNLPLATTVNIAALTFYMSALGW